MTAQLVRELETHAAALTARVVSEMYCDPFWSARRHGEQDGGPAGARLQ
ncbi:MAG: hypothetical protein RL685_5891 [Pseudomonadota bacterium]|jgi:hypothetical protein